MSLPPAAVLPIATTTTDLALLTGAFILRGWAFQETTNAAGATFVLRDGAAATDVIVAPITLATNESTRDYPPGNGLILRTGLYLDMVSGSIQGSIWYTPLTHRDDYELVTGEWGAYFTRPGL